MVCFCGIRAGYQRSKGLYFEKIAFESSKKNE